MIHIGKSYIKRVGETSRLCADITIGQSKNTLWFSIDTEQEEYLGVGRADAFVMAFLPAAMRDRHDIVCDEEMSERLHYQLCDYLIPTLASVGDLYHMISIRAPLTSVPYPNKGVIGTGFSGGVDCLYTIMTHDSECEIPLTHLTVYNACHYQYYERESFGSHRSRFYNACRITSRFAEEQGFQTVFLDTNFYDVLRYEFTDTVVSFRIIACTMALQGLFSTYLFSSSMDANKSMNFRQLDLCPLFDGLTVECAMTETLTIYSSGWEVKRWEKLEALADWKPSTRWLSSCFVGAPGERNCGHCTKCIRDLLTLYSLGYLDRYERLYDIQDFKKHLIQHIVFLKMNKFVLDAEVYELLKTRKSIPPQVEVYEKMFLRAKQNLLRTQNGNEEESNE